jgi:5-dehydro-2-deoxygluconokinase
VFRRRRWPTAPRERGSASQSKEALAVEDRSQSRPALDVITIGRSSIDLYGQQIGTRLEDVVSFAKSVGGCPANIAIGCSRLGLRSGLITRVGDEQMGRFIREQMMREGVAVDGVQTDPDRLTALVLLSVEDDKTFPLIFYRDNCADMALDESDIDPAFIASAKAVLVTGTHFSQPHTDAAQRKAMRLAKASGGKVVFDIDYRPNLWGLAGHAAGDARYIASAAVSERLRTVVPDCDLIVGTEEEVLIASGDADLHAALTTIRSLSAATIVLKRGPMGCVVYDGAIPDDLDDGVVGKGFPIEVYNVLGAGDGFMAGFLRGWLRGESLATSATWANACGALVVSRLLCSPEIPTFEELQHFLQKGSRHTALRMDEALSHIHWATNRRGDYPFLMALAIDHRPLFAEIAAESGADQSRIGAFKCLAVEAAAQIADRRPGFGVLLDDRYGRDALFAAARHGLWIGRPFEEPGSRPLRFEYSQDAGSRLIEWPVDHCIKCLCLYHPEDQPALKREQTEKLGSLHQAARKVGRELLVEIIASRNGPIADDTVARVLAELYAAGIRPDWWKLEPQLAAAAWRAIDQVIAANDPWCRGVVLLGLDASAQDLEAAFAVSRGAKTVRGFAVGRTIFSEAANSWFAGKIDDATAIKEMASRFAALTRAWKRQRQPQVA